MVAGAVHTGKPIYKITAFVWKVKSRSAPVPFIH